MTVYIAGPMTGLPEKNRVAFYKAEKNLEEQGFTVLNPAVLPDGMAPEQYLPICLAMLEQAEGIRLLDGWEDSPGARMEWQYAVYQGKTIYYPE